MKNLQRDVILILGKTGSGKTTYARSRIKNFPRVLIADADFQEFPAQHFDDFTEIQGYLETRGKPGSFFRTSYTPLSGEYPLMFDLARLVAPVHLVLEEADRFDDPRFCAEYEEIIARGRHWGISIVGISRHPFALPAMLRREATEIVAFHHHEPNDLKWFQDVLGEKSEILPKLKEHEFVRWIPGKDEKLEVQKLEIL